MAGRSRTGWGPVLGYDRYALTWWGVVMAAVVVLLTGPDLAWQDLVGADPGLWLLVGLVIFWDLRPIIASGGYDPEGVNLSTTFVFATLLRWGLGPAIVVLIAGTVAGEVARRKPMILTVYNVAQYSLSYLAGWLVLRAVGIDPTLADPWVPAAGDVGWVVLAAAAYHVVNLALVSVLVAPRNGRSVRAEFTTDLGFYTVTTGVVLAVAPLVAGVLEVEPVLVLLFLPPLLAVQRLAQMALRQEHLSHHDPLTGLPNRERLDAAVHDDLARRDAPAASALLLLDLDRFKQVNDTLGHQAGDDLLVQVAERLRADMRDGDMVARLGGDEFAVWLTDADMGRAVVIADRLLESLQADFELPSMAVDVDASIGVARYPQDGDCLEDLLRCADVAMYAAKDAGGGVAVYEAGRDPNTRQRLRLLAELRRAVAQDELELHYQPKVSFADGQVVGVEALVRWQHPDRGLLLPASFIELAAQSSMMREATDHVIRLAVAQAARWRDAGLAVPIAVNITPRDLADGRLVHVLEEVLEEHRLDPGLLRLEFTEHTLMDAPGVVGRAAAIAELGVGLSLDDFGTGYSSLTHLRRFPVTELKIDRSFVHEALTNDAIVRAIVDLARNLGLTTVAEGIETRAEWEAMRGLGCDAGQGYLLCPVLPVAEVTERLRTWGGDGREIARDTTAAMPQA